VIRNRDGVHFHTSPTLFTKPTPNVQEMQRQPPTSRHQHPTPHPSPRSPAPTQPVLSLRKIKTPSRIIASYMGVASSRALTSASRSEPVATPLCLQFVIPMSRFFPIVRSTSMSASPHSTSQHSLMLACDSRFNGLGV
jgi:hypothetical protein